MSARPWAQKPVLVSNGSGFGVRYTEQSTQWTLNPSPVSDGRVNVVTEAAPRVEAGDGSLSIYMVNQAPTWQYVNIEIKAAKTQDSEDEARAKTSAAKLYPSATPAISQPLKRIVSPATLRL